MANIFLSHSTIDGELANYICESFESRGLSCWIAPRNIRPGEDWASSITNAISEADVFFILYSKHSIKSSQCAKEIGIADRKKKYIIPYKIDDTEPEGAFDYYLTGCQWFVIDPSTGEYKMDELCDAIKGVIRQKGGEYKEIPKMIPIQSKPAPNAKTSSRKRTRAQKERRNLLIGGICVILLVCILALLGLTAIIRGVVGKEPATSEQGGMFSQIGETPKKYFEYEEVDGYIIITSYTGTDDEVVIPEEIDGKKVAALGGKIFFGNENITSVELPDTIVEIPTYAFYRCSNLKTVVIPEGIKFIGLHAFEECTSLSSVNLPDSVITIGDFAFYKCSNLSDVRMSDNIQSIGMYSFSNCNMLNAIVLPDTLVSIGDMAFAYCTSMKEVTIPMGIDSISASAFTGCYDITIYYNGQSYTKDIEAIVEQL